MTTYTNPFTGQTISPSQVSYESLSISVNTLLDWPINGTTGTPASNIIDVTATTTGLNLILPPATQVSTGQTVLIRNIGSNSFTVTSYAASGVGTTIVSVASGVAQFIYLTDNTTTAGTWASVVLGAGTSSANAASLAGYGLSAVGTLLNQSYSTVSYYSTITLPVTVQAKLVLWGGGVGTLTLPSASTAGAGWFCFIRNGGSGILTISPAGINTIDGLSSKQLQLTESLMIVSDGSNWNTFGYGQSSTFAYTQLSLSVTGGTTTLTPAQAANTIQLYSGTLTSNQTIVVPSTVQLYSITNNTTGSFTFTVKTAVSGGASVTVAQGTSLIVICDGTNVYNAASGASSSITSLTVGNGSLAVPSIKFTGDVNSGIYLPSTGQVGLVIANTLLGYYNSSGLTINGAGAFTGAVSGTTGTFTSGVSGGTF
jgi:hypothetical protein